MLELLLFKCTDCNVIARSERGTIKCHCCSKEMSTIRGPYEIFMRDTPMASFYNWHIPEFIRLWRAESSLSSARQYIQTLPKDRLLAQSDSPTVGALIQDESQRFEERVSGMANAFGYQVILLYSPTLDVRFHSHGLDKRIWTFGLVTLWLMLKFHGSNLFPERLYRAEGLERPHSEFVTWMRGLHDHARRSRTHAGYWAAAAKTKAVSSQEAFSPEAVKPIVTIQMKKGEDRSGKIGQLRRLLSRPVVSGSTVIDHRHKAAPSGDIYTVTRTRKERGPAINIRHEPASDGGLYAVVAHRGMRKAPGSGSGGEHAYHVLEGTQPAGEYGTVRPQSPVASRRSGVNRNLFLLLFYTKDADGHRKHHCIGVDGGQNEFFDPELGLVTGTYPHKDKLFDFLLGQYVDRAYSGLSSIYVYSIA